jgi:hypothetical protein
MFSKMTKALILSGCLVVAAGTANADERNVIVPVIAGAAVGAVLATALSGSGNDHHRPAPHYRPAPRYQPARRYQQYYQPVAYVPVAPRRFAPPPPHRYYDGGPGRGHDRGRGDGRW